MTHKLVEHMEENQETIEPTLESNSMKEQERSLEIISTEDHKENCEMLCKSQEIVSTNDDKTAKCFPQRTDYKQNDFESIPGETNNPLQNCESFFEGLDVECLWMNPEKLHVNTCSPSFSLADSLNLSSMGDSSSLQHWVDCVDSLLSWDGFNQLEQELFFIENSD